MNTDPGVSLEMRRKALVVRCAQQRIELDHEIEALKQPFKPAAIREYVTSHPKVPLSIIGVVLGVLATRPGRAMKLATAGLSAWKMLQGVLAMVRRP